jgi:hypothetical protein
MAEFDRKLTIFMFTGVVGHSTMMRHNEDSAMYWIDYYEKS